MSIDFSVDLYCDFCGDEITGKEGFTPYIEVMTNEGKKHFCKTCVFYETLEGMARDNEFEVLSSSDYIEDAGTHYVGAFQEIKALYNFIYNKTKEFRNGN